MALQRGFKTEAETLAQADIPHNDPWLVAFEAVREWSPPVLNVIGGIMLAWAALIDGSPRLILAIAGSCLLLIGTVASAWRQPQLNRLREQLPHLQQRAALGEQTIADLCRKELALISQGLNYWSSERITLFAAHPNGFTRVARYSACPPYDKSGRREYPLDQGCLGRAWRDGRASALELPDPTSDLGAWVEALRSGWSIPEEASSRFVMKSRAYVAFRIEGGVGDSLGVV